MKTTVDISDTILQEAKRLAAQHGVTLRALIERGLREVIDKETTGGPFKLRQVSFKGRGLQPQFRDGRWEEIRKAVYEGRGG